MFPSFDSFTAAKATAYLAARGRVPLVVHEANARPGLANRVAARWADAVAALARDRGGRAIAVQADVSDAAAMARVVDDAERQFGRIDGVFHTAGAVVCNNGNARSTASRGLFAG